MNFFSRRETEPTPQSSVIPADILAAVSVMGEDRASEGQSLRVTNQSRGASPFLSGGMAEGLKMSQPSEGAGSPARKVAEERSKMGPLATPVSRGAFFQNKKLIFVILGGLVVLFLLGGAVLWYLKRSPARIEAPVIEVSTPPESVVSTSVTMLPYSPETANYLSLDTETVTADSFGAMLKHAGEQIVSANMTKPVEFLLTDKNNNPLAFSRFAYLMNLGLPEALLATFGESFSLFVYNDNGNARFGLQVTFADPQGAKKLIPQSEKGFPYLFRSVLFQGVTVPREVLFRSGVYNGESVRFVNIDAAQNISCDFVVREGGLSLGTSKETLRAILDKKR